MANDWKKKGSLYVSACGQYIIEKDAGAYYRPWVLREATAERGVGFERLKDAKLGIPRLKETVAKAAREDRRRKAIETCATCRRIDAPFARMERQAGLTLAELRAFQEAAEFRAAVRAAHGLIPGGWDDARIRAEIRKALDGET